MHIRLGRKKRVHFQSSSPGIERDCIQIVDGNHHMRVAHPHSSHGKTGFGEFSLSARQTIHQWQGRGHRLRLQERWPHIHKQLTIILQFRTNQTCRSLD